MANDNEDKFDVIVVGAGPAGSACAYTLAKAGRNVLLLERGNSAGSKNVSGGRLYTYALELVEQGLYERAPLQRKIVREQIMLLGADSAMTVDYFNPAFGAQSGGAAPGAKVPQSFSVVRASLDEWFAGEAEAAGATVVPGMLVDGLIEENGKIAGIKIGDEEMRADLVVAADGVNSLLGQKAGLFPDASSHAVGVGVKETIELPDSIINQRFGVTDAEGAARVAIGCTDGISGGAFLYTNKGSVSLGIVFNPEQAGKQQRHIQDIFQDFKMHPAIQALIEGGTSIEYGAHLVPENGYDGIPKRLYRDGFLVVGDAAAGEAVFKKCHVCHNIGEGAKNMVGPELNGVVGRHSGTVEGYNYSDANKNSGLTWDEATLTIYLKNPKAEVPGTKMTFPGLQSEDDIKNVIAYLKQFGPDGKKM